MMTFWGWSLLKTTTDHHQSWQKHHFEMTFPVWKFPDLKKGRVEGSNLSKFLKLSEWTLKYLILTFGKKTKLYSKKRQQQTANTHNLQFLSTKKREKNTFHIGFTVLVGWDFLNWHFFVGWFHGHGQFQLRSRSLELSNNPPVGWWKDVEVVIRFSPPLLRKKSSYLLMATRNPGFTHQLRSR